MVDIELKAQILPVKGQEDSLREIQTSAEAFKRLVEFWTNSKSHIFGPIACLKPLSTTVSCIFKSLFEPLRSETLSRSTRTDMLSQLGKAAFGRYLACSKARTQALAMKEKSGDSSNACDTRGLGAL